MLTTADLRLGPTKAVAAEPTTSAVEPLPFEPGTAGAMALGRVWQGKPGTILSSPPGGGKSTTIANIAATLAARIGLHVIVATPTRAQAVAITETLMAKVPYGQVELVMSNAALDAPPQVLNAKIADRDSGWVKVRTLAALATSRDGCDVLIVDEAYQATFADVTAAAGGAQQLLLVGDMGQIGPVVTADTSAFERWNRSPHIPAPDMFSRRRDEFVTFSIDRTYRLGPRTVELIAPLYPFRFESHRPPQRLEDSSGPLPEVGHVNVGTAASVNDLGMLTQACDRAAQLVGTVHAVKGPDGQVTRMDVGQADVAVIAAYNTQVSFIRAALDERGLKDVTVGTADRLQGGQWTAVVAVDPTAGATNLASHNVSPGRMCVMLSRHTSHLCWIGEDKSVWSSRLSTGEVPARDRGLGVKLRTWLSKTPAL